MAVHAHTTTPAPIARRRAAGPAVGKLDRRVRGLPAGVIDAATRRRIEDDIERLIALLDAIDAPAMDLEDSDEDCCAAADDDPASSTPRELGADFWRPGDPLDGESTCEDEGEAGVTEDDFPAPKWEPHWRALSVPQQAGPGPFKGFYRCGYEA